MYPFFVLSKAGLERMDFEPVTNLYGGNGSGKTTILNVVAEKLGVQRSAPYNRSNFFEDYVRMCRVHLDEAVPPHSRIVTSDDVFDYMLSIRSLNEGIDRKKELLFDEHFNARHSTFRVRSLEDYEALKKRNSARRKTQSAFVREQLMINPMGKAQAFTSSSGSRPTRSTCSMSRKTTSHLQGRLNLPTFCRNRRDIWVVSSSSPRIHPFCWQCRTPRFTTLTRAPWM